MNTSLVSGLADPQGLALSADGTNILVANPNGGGASSGTIGEYNAVTGAAVNASLITGLNYPTEIVVAAVPEPATWAAGVGVVLLLAFHCRKNRRQA